MTRLPRVDRRARLATLLWFCIALTAPPAFARDCDGNVIELGRVSNTSGSWAVLAV